MNSLFATGSRALTRQRVAWGFVSCALTWAFAANAQPAPPAVPAPMDAAAGPATPLAPPPAPPARGDMPPAALGPTEGQVTGYLLSPEAEVSGVLLDNGRQIHVPPHLGAQLADVVKPGERVRFSGEAEPARPGTAPTPWVITAVATGRTLTDTPPAPGDAPPAPPAQGERALQPMKANGTVKQVLTGPRGEPDGVLLDSGAQVAIPPHAARATAGMLSVGTRLNVEGYGRSSRYGTVVQATALSRPGEAPVAIYAPGPMPMPAPMPAPTPAPAR